MRQRLIKTTAAAGAVLAATLGLVVAQEAQLPTAQAPPDDSSEAPPPAEAAPPPGPSQPTVGADGLPTAPVPYTVLGPTNGARRAARAPRAAGQGAAPVATTATGEPLPAPQRPRHTGAILQAVDKVTAETLRFEAEIGKPVRYKTLVFTVRACETEAVDELIKESAAHVTVTSQPKVAPGRVQPEAAQVYRGWMFASSPALNPFAHPVYDAWLVACQPSATEAPAAVPGAPAKTAAAPAATPG